MTLQLAVMDDTVGLDSISIMTSPKVAIVLSACGEIRGERTRKLRRVQQILRHCQDRDHREEKGLRRSVVFAVQSKFF